MSTPVILIIDDNLFFLDKLKHQATAAGYTPRTVMFATALAPALAEETPAAIAINLDADRLDAVEIVKDLRGQPHLADTPIIGFAGHVHEDLLEAGRNAGATRVVSNGQMANGFGALLADLGVEPAAP